MYTKPIPKIELQNDILRFSFDQSETISLEDPFIIENKDFKIFQDIKRFQQNDDISLLKSYINRDPSVSLQIYRTTQRPTKYTSFQGNLYKTLKLNSNSNSFFDTITKNVKYYYLFRYLNKHNLPSNSSKVLEIELIDEDDYLELRQQEIVLNPDVPKALTKDMKKYLLIRPSIIQIRPNMKMGVENSDQIEVGPSYEKVWNKDFILRIKSKKTQRVLEFNLKSLINKKI